MKKQKRTKPEGPGNTLSSIHRDLGSDRRILRQISGPQLHYLELQKMPDFFNSKLNPVSVTTEYLQNNVLESYEGNSKRQVCIFLR